MSPPEPDDRLSSLVRQALREQPDAQAPADLADRVLREIERRHAQVWWQRSLAFWPRTAQLLFVVASIACAVLLWLLFSQAKHASPSAHVLLGSASLSHWSSTVALVQDAVRGIAPLWHQPWLYESLVVAMSLYSVLFALLAVAYVTLWRGARRAPAARIGARPA